MPRVLNASMAVFLLAITAPVLTHFGGRQLWVQLVLLALVMPVLVVVLLCLAAALRPGCLGRATRQLRRSR